MPVYLVTVHAYRSWSEGNPRGYVQRGEGLKPASEALARWRREHARFPPVRFTMAQQRVLHDVAVAVANDQKVRLHAVSTTPTHLHVLVSFRSPACTCRASAESCAKGCPGRVRASALCTALKRKAGQQLARQAAVTGRRWLSEGKDLTRCRGREHFDHLVALYLPEHERTQGGLFCAYG